MISYLKGDATQPVGEGPRIIVHCCNDAGGWGSGFVVAVSRRWSQPEIAYRMWHEIGHDDGAPFVLGAAQLVDVGDGIHVVNVIGQHNYGGPTGEDYPYVRYAALEAGFRQVSEWARAMKASVHMPRLGCGLAGGKWDEVAKIIERTIGDLDVFVYDL